MAKNNKSNSEIFSKSIAVLPFVNMSPDPENEYFSDGITEEIINALTKINNLKVISRTSAFSFKGKHIDIRDIGNQLDVSTVLEGSVRKYNGKVRITAQLININDGSHLWSHSFDRNLEDIFKVQDEISLIIADKIRENFGHLEIQDHLVKESTQSFTAYEYFLKGRFNQLKWDAPSIKQAIECYNSAIEIDPNFARAYYGNMQSFGLLAAWGYMDQDEGFQKAILNFQKAKEIDTQLPEYYLSFVGKYFWGEWNFKATYEQTKEALEINPNYSDALEAMTELFISHGFFQEATKYVKIALETDPLSANHNYTFANINYKQKKYSEAIVLLNKAIQINPDLILAKELKAMCLLRLKEKIEFEKLLDQVTQPSLIKLLYEVINNNKDIDKNLLNDWENVVENKNQLIPLELYILANSNYKKEAISLLKKYIHAKRGQIMNYRVEPFLEPLREYEEFDSLYKSNLNYEDISELKEKETTSKFSHDEITNLKTKLINYLEEEKPFLNPHLALNELASLINIHPNKLSFIINEQTGKNFNEFINSFRLKHFKKIASEEEFKNMTILGLAYESGFNSKSVFHTYFRKAEGITPSNWIKSLR